MDNLETSIAADSTTGTTISHVDIKQGVFFEAESVEVLQTLANALYLNASALLTIAQVFKSSSVSIGSAISINQPKEIKEVSNG